MYEAVRKARELYAAGEINWPAPAILALENKYQGSGLEWVILCAWIFLERNQVANQIRLIGWIYELDVAFDHGRSSGLKQKSEEIWFTPNRSLLQTSVCHMYEALFQLLERNIVKYQTSLIRAIRSMMHDPDVTSTGFSLIEEAFLRLHPSEDTTA